MIRLIPLALIAASLAACTTATPYQPYRAESVSGVHGGYSDRQIAPDRYLVEHWPLHIGKGRRGS